MGEKVFTAFSAAQLPQGVILTGVRFDDAEGCAFAIGAGVLHGSMRSK